MDLEAPSRIIRQAREDAVDEVANAEACFFIARDLDGQAMGPGPLSAALGRERTYLRRLALARLAIASLVDGALGEGTSARLLAEVALEADDPEVRAALAVMARTRLGTRPTPGASSAGASTRAASQSPGRSRAPCQPSPERVGPARPPAPPISSASVPRGGNVKSASTRTFVVTLCGAPVVSWRTRTRTEPRFRSEGTRQHAALRTN